MNNVQILEDGCGSGLPHGQHTVRTDSIGVRWLCEGTRKSDYEHCGEPGYHPQHRTGPDQKGPYCLGVMSMEEKVRYYKLPVIRLTNHELAALLQGEMIYLKDSAGNHAYITKHTPETLLEAADKAREGVDPDLLPPPMSREQAENLTKGI